MSVPMENRRQLFLDLADVIAPHDSVREALTAALDDPAGYLETYDDTAERLGDPVEADDPQLPWLALVDRSMAALHAVEVDWRERRDDILWSLEQLRAYAAVTPDTRAALAALACDGATIDCLRAMAAALDEDGLRLAALDIDADSYVLALLDSNAYQRASSLAERLGFALRDIREHDPNA